MKRFVPHILNPLETSLAKDFDAALEAPDKAARVEQLLQFKETAWKKFDALARQEGRKGDLAVTVSIVAAVASLALPGVLAFAVGAAALAGLRYGWAKYDNIREVKNLAVQFDDSATLHARKTAEEYPAEAVKSPRFAQQLREKFNLGAPADGELEQLQAYIRLKPGFSARGIPVEELKSPASALLMKQVFKNRFPGVM